MRRAVRGTGGGGAERLPGGRGAVLRRKSATDTAPHAPDALTAILAASKPRKYQNQPMEVDSERFDSKREAARYEELKQALAAGAIRDLEIHPRFPLVVHDIDCGAYVGDFAYIRASGDRVVEDVKSPATRKLPTYRLKRRLVWALYGLTIKEV